MSNESIRPIFYDPSRRRASRVQRVTLFSAILFAVLFTLFSATILYVPISHRLRLSPPRFLPDSALRSAQPRSNPKSDRTESVPVVSSLLKKPKQSDVSGKADGVVGGFYVSWDQTSLASLREHAHEMTHLFPGWLHVNETGTGLIIRDNDPTDAEARRLALQNHVRVVPLINNFSNSVNDFDETRLHLLLRSAANRQTVVKQLLDYVKKNHFAGVNLDLETQDEEDRLAIATFTDELSRLFHPGGLLVTVCTQVDGDQTTTRRIAQSSDFIVLMNYDYHWSGGPAGPIAPVNWERANIQRILRILPPNKIVLAVGNYAYDWIQGTENALSLTFGEAMNTAQESLDNSTDTQNGIIRWDKASNNPFFTYEEDNKQHDVWAMDAATAYNVVRYAQNNGITGRALWYIGSEDPSMWTFFGKQQNPTDVSALHTVRYGFELAFDGTGEALDVTSLPQVGQRVLQTDTQGYITQETYTKYPTACVVRRSGEQKKQIALTFDDGPDPRWTNQVLDALKVAKAPATFFVIGVNAQNHPDLLRREWREGHLIGNHSFYHPNLALVSQQRARLEIDATERAIQAATMHSTTLFRPPYGIDTEPSTTQEIVPLIEAQKFGYITIGEGIDPRDWEGNGKTHTAEEIADQVLSDANAGRGNVVLLHDSGGDRSETIRAIPLLVSRLRNSGYRIVPVNELIGKTRDVVMPEVRGKERWIALFDRAVFSLSAQSGNFFALTFLLSLIAGTARLLVTAILALRHAAISRESESAPSGVVVSQDAPLVSVVIAAYNEEKVIARTIQALLDGIYTNLEVIVVDDGSQDRTSATVHDQFHSDPRVRLFTKSNGGKASALNFGIERSSGTILIGLDADTLFSPDTLNRLVRHFDDLDVGAVAGNIMVGNRVNLLTRWQSVEYTTSQNFDRRAYDVMNAIPVVPGCIGAWRKDAVVSVGLYQRDTLAEDADLTWRIRKAGWRIVCDNSALAFTEAPERLADLMKQRFRWTFGTLQVLWKHRDACLNPRLGAFGMVVIPCMWLFQFLLPLTIPIADAGIIATLFSSNRLVVFAYCTFFFFAEFAAANLAFDLDGTDSSRRADLKYLFLQRFAYRYILYVVLLRAVVAAVKGVPTGWGKLDRAGTARVSMSGAVR